MTLSSTRTIYPYLIQAYIYSSRNYKAWPEFEYVKKLPQQSNIKTGFHDERAQYKKVFFSEKESHL